MVEGESSGPSVQTTPYQSPMHMFAGSINTLTNPDNDLYKLELMMRGLFETDKGPVQAGVPLLNEHGIRSVLGIAQTTISRSTILSNLNEFQIERLMLFLNDTLARDLMRNRVTYGFLDWSVRDKVFFEVLTQCFITMNRPKDEGERRFWKGSQQEITTRVDGVGARPRGLFSLFGGK